MLRLEALVDLLEHLVLDLVVQAVLSCSLRNRARWQVQVYLVNDMTQVPLHEGHDDRLGQLLAIRLRPAIMLDLDVQVQ